MSDERKAEMKKLVDAATRKLVDDGLLVEAGWVGFVIACKLGDAPPVQHIEMRKAFFAGAVHLFSSIMSFLEPGREPTDKDLKRMSQVCDELDRFQKEFEAHMKRRN
jgi:hypothetical protein